MTQIIYRGVRYSNTNMSNLAEKFSSREEAISYARLIKKSGGFGLHILNRNDAYYVIWKTKSIKFRLFGA